ncbi:hypothetical protein DVH24_016143 [Malus domestica]|uniref:Uncharacterized protein n=1 Tax=Malus domestica TaxID=3750 RepID=A0A498JG15_MALDO|nr:hypothetical protein DVH24_016143 [Malus domestica]
MDRVEERQHPDAMVDEPGKLFAEVNLNTGEANILETEGELLADARGDLGVLEGLGAREAVEIGWVEDDKLLLG